jgi:hypothetical protein
MKNIILLSSLIAIGFITSCTKEDIVKPEATQPKVVTLSGDSKSSITLLEFASYEHFFSTIKTLNEMVEKHNNDFLAKHTDLDDDALNARAEAIGFNDYQPLINFEKQYNVVNSMRQLYANAEEEWLNNEELDPETDPSKKYCFGNVEMSLLNAGGEVKIGDKLLKMTNKGFIEIKNIDVVTLLRIDNGDWTALNEPTVNTEIEIEGMDSKGCHHWRDKDQWDTYSTDRKVKMQVHFHSWPARGTARVELDSYKKSGNKWKKHKMNLGIAVQSYMKTKNCEEGPTAWSGWKRKKRKSINNSNTSWGAFPQYRAESGQSVYGYFEYAGKSQIVILTW